MTVANVYPVPALWTVVSVPAVKPKDALNAYREIIENYKGRKIISFVAGIQSKKYLKINKDIQFLRAMQKNPFWGSIKILA